MKSGSNMMGKCTRCEGGIYTAWRTLDDKRFYHPHCFTCVVCGKTLELEEAVEDGEVAAVKEIYCLRCYARCFHRDMDERQCQSPFNSSASRNAGDQEYLSSLSDNFNFKFQPRHENTSPMLENMRSSSDMNLLFSSQTYNSAHGHHDHEENMARQHIKHSLPRPPQRGSQHQGNNICNSQGRIPTPMENIPQQHYENSEPKAFRDMQNSKSNVRSSQRRISTPRENIPQQHYENNVPNAFRELQNSKSNVRKLERQNSRIPRPITPSVSRKSTVTVLNESSKPLSTSKSKVSSQAKLGNSSRSSTNSRSTVNTASSSKLQKSLSWVQPKSSKSKTQDVVGSASGTKKNQPNKVASRTRPRSPPEEKLTALVGSPSSQSQASACRRQCAASFSNNERCFLGGYLDYHPQPQYDGAVGGFVQEAYNFEYQNQNDIHQLQQNAAMAAVPSPQAILSAIRRENSTLNKSNLSKFSYPAENQCTDINGNKGPDAMMPNAKMSFHVTFECPICISSLVPGNESALLNARRPFGNGNVVTTCGHMFHRDCLENWLKIKGNKRCPICSAFCMPETLQPVFLECNLSADLDSKTGSSRDISNVKAGNVGKKGSHDAGFKALRSEYDNLKEKYNAILSQKDNYSLKVTIANSLQNAYDMECRNRLTLQWENKKLLRQIEALQSRLQQYTADMTN